MTVLALVLLQRPNVVVHSYNWTDPKQNRSVPVRVSFPSKGKNLPVIVLSHSNWGTENSLDPLVTYWAQNGYAVFQPRHLDAALPPPKSLPDGSRPPGGPIRFLLTRLSDCEFMYSVVKNVKSWVPELSGRLNSNAIIQAGHVQGANTTQTLGGMKRNGRSFSNPTPIAFCCISPQGVGLDLDERSWSDFKRPLMVISGTNDSLPMDANMPRFSPETHQNPFRLSPKGDKFLLWIQGATPNFGGISSDPVPNAGRPNPLEVRWIQDATLAFFDAYAKKDLKKLWWLKNDELASQTKGEAVVTYR